MEQHTTRRDVYGFNGQSLDTSVARAATWVRGHSAVMSRTMSAMLSMVQLDTIHLSPLAVCSMIHV